MTDVAEVGTATQTAWTNSDSPTVDFPSGVQSGYLLVAHASEIHGHSLNIPSGWTEIATQRGVGGDLSCRAFYRYATGAETSETLSGLCSSSSDDGACAVSCYSGVKSSSPINVAASYDNGTVTSVSGPSVTPDTDRCMVVQACFCDPSSGSTTGTADTSPVPDWHHEIGHDNQNVRIQGYIQTTAAALAWDYTSLPSDTWYSWEYAILPEPSGNTASGSPSMPVPTASGSASRDIPASGSPSMPVPTASGTATREISASGSGTLGAITATGSAKREIPASGSPTMPVPSASGFATREIQASGTPSTPIPTASGDATVGSEITASGTPTLPVPTASGAASREPKASGSPTLAVPTASGLAVRGILALGSVAIAVPTAAGSASHAMPGGVGDVPVSASFSQGFSATISSGYKPTIDDGT